MANVSKNSYIFSDLNVRDSFVSSSLETLLYDSKVVVQSVWRLINTVVGEIPNFRDYGLDIKQFLQFPLNKKTINDIYEYVSTRIEFFEDRAEVLNSVVDVDFEQGIIFMKFVLRVKSTGEVVSLPLWSVQVATV